MITYAVARTEDEGTPVRRDPIVYVGVILIVAGAAALWLLPYLN
jgi:hypothetical protein